MADDGATSESFDDGFDPARARALEATLGLDPRLAAGDALPPFFHQVYFWNALPPDRLGPDGHPRVGSGLIPDLGLPRRMWAGGRLRWEAPLIAGQPATKRTAREDVARKAGRTGPLAFVTLRHTVSQNGQVCVTEWQDLVYRSADPAPVSKPPMARTDETTRREVTFSPTLLFRYSALTFNGHRIHYDLDYATGVEGYGGLVVHGPLLAQLLMLMAWDELGPLRGFTFRATAPLMHTEPATLCRAGSDLWVRGPDGRQCMIATAEPLS